MSPIFVELRVWFFGPQDDKIMGNYILKTIALAPIAVEILLCRGSAQKIGTYSGKKLQKNNIKPKNKNHSNNPIQKIKRQIPIQPKITTRRP